MLRNISGFLRRDHGQGLSEYCLITALIALIALGIFWRVSGGITALWNDTNTSISTAGGAAGTGTAGSTTTGAAAPSGGATSNP